MDLCAEMLHRECQRPQDVHAELTCPAWSPVATLMPGLGRVKLARSADRAWNRYWRYPRHARAIRDAFDWFHLCDHSYGHLAEDLPQDRTGIYCHDVDAFRGALDPATPMSSWMRRLAQRLVCGLQRVAVVFVNTRATRQELLDHRLVPPERIVLAPLGVAADYSPQPGETDPAAIPPALQGHPFLFHLGSCIPRKRIDVLLEVFARVSATSPDLRLLQVGGTWTADQLLQLERLGLTLRVCQVRGVATSDLAACYRQAALVLQPSSYEGFGLPVAEALACGAPVVASDIPALREVGGEAALYCPVGDVDAWTTTVTRVLGGQQTPPAPAVRALQAAKFSWAEHARTILDAYRALPLRPTSRA